MFFFWLRRVFEVHCDAFVMIAHLRFDLTVAAASPACMVTVDNAITHSMFEFLCLAGQIRQSHTNHAHKNVHAYDDNPKRNNYGWNTFHESICTFGFQAKFCASKWSVFGMQKTDFILSKPKKIVDLKKIS